MYKKIVSFALAIAVLLAMMPTFAAAVEIPGGESRESRENRESRESTGAVYAVVAAPEIWEGGAGTERSPYVIKTEKNLAYLAKKVNSGAKYGGKYFALANDISLTGGWRPIGYSENDSFNGIFDGKNHTISGLSIAADLGCAYTGLFGRVGGSGRILNLRIQGSVESEGGAVGGLVGRLEGNGFIFNCSMAGSVSGKQNTGGLVGIVAGAASHPRVEHSRAQASVNGTIAVGGLIGSATGGAVIASCQASSNVAGTTSVGGLIGSYAGCSVSLSYAAGDVSGIGSVGGLIGNIRYGDASSPSKISNCYSIANASGNSNVCGLIGNATGNPTEHDANGIANCYASGRVAATNTRANGLSWNYKTALISDSYYNAEYIGCIDNGRGKGLAETQMKDASSFVGFEFGDVWGIDSGINKGYPYLLSLPPGIDAERVTTTIRIETKPKGKSANLPVAGAIVEVYADQDMTQLLWNSADDKKYTKDDGTIEYEWTGKEYAHVSGAESGQIYITAHKDICKWKSTRKDVIESFAGERFLLQLRSETYDEESGKLLPIRASANQRTATLALTRPRVLLNMTLAYIDNQSDDSVMKEAIEDTLNIANQRLFGITNGYFSIAKVSVKEIPYDGEVSATSVMKKVTADIKMYELDYDYYISLGYEPESAREASATHMGSHATYTFGATPPFLVEPGKYEGAIEDVRILWNTLNKNDIGKYETQKTLLADSLLHEMGHYVFGFGDEYKTGDDESYTLYGNSGVERPSGMSQNFGLMDQPHVSIQLSLPSDYAYTFDREDPKQINMHYKQRAMSCWEWLSRGPYNATNTARRLDTFKANGIDYEYNYEFTIPVQHPRNCETPTGVAAIQMLAR